MLCGSCMRVAVRVRPLSENEVRKGCEECVEVHEADGQVRNNTSLEQSVRSTAWPVELLVW